MALRRVSMMFVVLSAVLTGAGCPKENSSQSSAGVNERTPGSGAEGAAVTKGNPPATGAEGTTSSSSASGPSWKPIMEGKEVRFAGVVAHVPGTWAVQPQGNATLVMPAGANQASIDEIYGFVGEPTLKTLDNPQLEAYLDAAVVQLLQVPAQRVGAAEAVRVGGLDGKSWKWTARLMDGRDVEVRSWGFVGSYAGSFVAIATPQALKLRMPEVEQILGSLHKPAAAEIDAARLCGTWVRAFGDGTALIGNANEQRITFEPSGRFHYHSEGTSHGVFHTGSSQTDITGSWRLVGDQLTGVSDTGETQTFTLEARTEAGTGAAVIAIDGTEFRQAEGRPW